VELLRERVSGHRGGEDTWLQHEGALHSGLFLGREQLGEDGPFDELSGGGAASGTAPGGPVLTIGVSQKVRCRSALAWQWVGMISSAGDRPSRQPVGTIHRGREIPMEMPLDVFRHPGTPHEAVAPLRDAGPIHQVTLPNGLPVWFITRYAEARAALSDPRLSNAAFEALDLDALPPQLRAATNSHLLRMDPPNHTRMRKLVSAVFVPRHIERLRPRVRQITDDLLDRLVDRSDADLIAEYAFPLPVQVICELFGVPAEDRDRFRHWSNAIVTSVGSPVFPVQEITEYVDYLHALIERKRAEPDNALLSALISARDDNDRLTEDELVSTVYLFVIAGHETTLNLIGNGIYLLLRDPERAGRIRARPGELPLAIDEFLRYETPVTAGAMRIATEPMTLFGAEVAAGDRIMVSLLSANRDPGAFEEPDELRLTREPNQHLAFGHGIHYCIGAPLARLEAQVALGNFLDRFPKAQLATAAAGQWRPGIFIRGLASLPVALGR
jgi:cytochrome P450